MNKHFIMTSAALCLAAVTGWLGAAEIRINTYPVQITENNGKWNFELKQKFAGKVAIPPYFLLPPSGFLPVSPVEKRRGYAHPIELNFKVPGPAVKVSGSAVIGNYNDGIET